MAEANQLNLANPVTARRVPFATAESIVRHMARKAPMQERDDVLQAGYLYAWESRDLDGTVPYSALCKRMGGEVRDAYARLHQSDTRAPSRTVTVARGGEGDDLDAVAELIGDHGRAADDSVTLVALSLAWRQWCASEPAARHMRAALLRRAQGARLSGRDQQYALEGARRLVALMGVRVACETCGTQGRAHARYCPSYQDGRPTPVERLLGQLADVAQAVDDTLEAVRADRPVPPLPTRRAVKAGPEVPPSSPPFGRDATVNPEWTRANMPRLRVLGTA